MAAHEKSLDYFIDLLRKDQVGTSVFYTVKTVNFGTPEIIAVFILKFVQGDFSIQQCVQKMMKE